MAALCATVGIAAALGTTTAAQASKSPITILTIVDTTGATSYLGKADLAGLDAAITYYNKHGGIDGHKIHQVVESDNGNPVTSATVLQKYLASNPKPTYIFPGSFSTIAGALQPIISQAKILSWGFGDGNSACEFNAAVKCGGFFSLAPAASVEVNQALKYFKSKGWKKVGIIQDLRDTSIVETQYLQQLAPKYGIKLYLQTFPASTVDLTPEMSAAEVRWRAGGVVGDDRPRDRIPPQRTRRAQLECTGDLRRVGCVLDDHGVRAEERVGQPARPSRRSRT